MKKRIISLFLSVVMVLTLVPLLPLGVAADSGTLLMSLTRTTATAAEAGNKFSADEGVFASVSELTAWNNNEQIVIGGTGRTPIVINNAAVNNNTSGVSGWRSVGNALIDSNITVNTATAFQIKFSTTGHSGIRFSATQKSTGSGPQFFALAYSIGSATGPFTHINGSETAVTRVSNDAYAALVPSYDRFLLPSAVNGQAEVYLRVYMVDSTLTERANGNTSINDIVITAGGSGGTGVENPHIPPPRTGRAQSRPGHIIINQVYGNGGTGTGAVSHGFIELYNPTGTAVDMGGMSIQYIKGVENGVENSTYGNWQRLNLTGKTIAANSSFLITSTVGANPSARYEIPNSDMTWNIPFSNRAFSVALVNNQTTLEGDATDNTLPGVNIIDLVGVQNDGARDSAPFYEGRPFTPISQQASARRYDFADYNENQRDFERVDYRTAHLEVVKPRSSHDPAWGADIFPVFRVPAAERLVFSQKSGFYNNPVNLTLTTGFTGGVVIRFTRDGSEPTFSGINSFTYSAPINITNRTNDANVYGTIAPNQNGEAPTTLLSKGTVIRAKVFDTNGVELTSKTYTQSYFVGLGNRYADLPVISLSTDYDNLFHPLTGIYMPPRKGDESQHNSNVNYEQRGREWERPVHFEIIEPDGTTHSQDMGVRIHGGWSRRWAQKSLRLYARGEYDPDNPTLKHDIFDGNSVDVNGEPITEFQRIILRNGGNDFLNTMMRDSMLQDAAKGLNVSGQAYRPAVAFINGEFWGYYCIRERVDEYYYRDKFALDNRRNIGFFTNASDSTHYPEELRDEPENPDLLDDFKFYSEMYDFFKAITGDMTDAEYIQAQKFLDMDNFIDYWAYNLIIGQGDWPHNNLNIWRYRTESFPSTTEVTSYDDGRWRYNLRDLDFAFDIYNHGYLPNNLANILNGTGSIDSFVTNGPQTVFIQKLMTNEDFKQRFIARACDIMNTNARTTVMNAKIDAFADVIEPVVAENMRRWGRPWHNFQTWEGNITTFRGSINPRNNQFRGQLNTYFKLGGNATINIENGETKQGHIRLNGANIVSTTPGVTNPAAWNGIYLIGNTQTVTAVPAEGYQFKQFTINETVYTTNPVQFELEGSTTISVEFEEAVIPPKPCGECGVFPCKCVFCSACKKLIQDCECDIIADIDTNIEDGEVSSQIFLGEDGYIILADDSVVHKDQLDVSKLKLVIMMAKDLSDDKIANFFNALLVFLKASG